MSGSPIVGIDLGTTHSAVAALVDGRPQALPNRSRSSASPAAPWR